jgi:dihydrofolate synthase/folylpolyglutamate synthase
VEAIAGEKAGIIKPGRPVVGAVMDPAAEAVVRRVARERRAPFIPVCDSVQVRRTRQTWAGQRVVVETPDEAIGPLVLPLLGSHQLANVATAVTALLSFAEASRLPVSSQAIERGLSDVYWPGRLQVMEQHPTVVVDGAHNPPAAEVLVRSIRELAPKQPVGLVASFLSDKDATGFLRAWSGVAKKLWVLPLHGERAMPLADIQAAARAAHLEATPMPDLAAALHAAKTWAEPLSGVTCVTGSLYLAGEALQRYGSKV